MITAIIIGIVAGYLANRIMKGSGNGLILNLILGIIGGIVGNWLLGNMFFDNVLGQIIRSTIGAIICVFVYGLIKKGK